MDNLEWRRKARVVAYVDLVMCSIAVVAVIVIIVALADDPEILSETELMISEIWDREFKIGSIDLKGILVEYTSAISVRMWPHTIVILSIGLLIRMWAAVKLLEATDVGIQFHEALGKARTYRNASVAFLILLFHGILVMKFNLLILEIVGAVLRSPSLYIIQKFMSEVQSRL